MKVLFDHQIFSWQKYGGISRYFYEIMRNFPSNIEVVNSTLLSDNQYIKSKDIVKHFSLNSEVESKLKTQIYYNVNKINSVFKQISIDFDILHPTYYDPYFLNFIGKKPYVLTVHDLIHERYPELFDINDLTIKQKKKAIINATKIIAVSENTKKDILEFYDYPEDKIEVIHHGFELKHDISIINKIKKLPSRYLLFIGERERYKNFTNMVSALSLIMKMDKELYLICTGKTFTSEEIELIKRLEINDQVIKLEANDNELKHLYSNAIAFIYPSFYEGFGIPILESFALNCPVILSNASSFPEVAGDAGCYFNPFNIDSIRNAIETVIYDNTLRNELIEKGKNRLKLFSWKNTAVQTANLYSKI